VGGKDTYAGGWVYFVCDLSGTPDANNGTNASITTCQDLGVGGKCLAKSADDNFQMDLMHYGTGGVTITGTPDTGGYGTGNSWEEIYDIVDTNNYGVMSKQAGSYVLKAPVTIGGSSTTTFNDADTIIFFEDMPVSNTYYKLKTDAISTNNTTLTGFIIKTEGDTAVEIDFSASITSLTYDASTSLDNGLITFKSGTYTGDKFVDCAGITANAGAILDGFITDTIDLITLNTTAILKNSNISESATTKAVICEDLARVDNNLFTSDGTGHAVELTSVGDGTMDWTNTESGYASSDGSTGNETVYVNVGTGTLTINVGTGASTPTIRTAGATVNVVSGQATITINAKDESNNNNITNSAVTIKAGETGNLPYNDSVTISSKGMPTSIIYTMEVFNTTAPAASGIATVSHTAHGLSTGQKVAISGANENEYNRIKTITVVDANSYTYPLTGTPTSPATGTITCTAVIIDGTTNASGVISDTRSYSVNQSFTGLIQKGTGSDIYKARTTSGTIDKDNGVSQTILLTKD